MRPNKPVTRRRSQPDKPADRGGWLVLLIVLAGVGIYANSLSGVFLLDDLPRIVRNPVLKQSWQSGAWLDDDLRRPLVGLSLAINYALGQLNVRGYHAFNIAVHVLAGLILFGIIRRTLHTDALRVSYGRSASRLAFVIALIWVVHPLQTGSVTYIIQRCESMMGLFYLLTLYCVLRGADSPRGLLWYAAAIVSCTLGMTCKAVMVTAPLMILLYDRIFLAKGFRELLRRRWGLYLGLVASLAFLADGGLFQHVRDALSALPNQKMVLSQNPEGVSPLLYAATQSAVILHYLGLSFWPSSLCLDYWWPLVSRVADVLPQILVIGALLLATVWALWRQPRLGFLGLWFFLILAPTSSIRPLNNVAFEHRMYLPLAAVVALAVLAGYRLLSYGRERFSLRSQSVRVLATVLVVAIVTSLGYATVQRNQVYRSALAMWTDVARKRPQNPRAFCHLGVELAKQGNLDNAITLYRKALRIRPNHDISHYNLANALSSQGNGTEAMQHYREAIRLRPAYAEAHINLGSALAKQNRPDEAIVEFLAALKAESDGSRPRPAIMARAYVHLGNAHFKRREYEEAVAAYRRSLRLQPGQPRAHYNMAVALKNLHRIDEAIEQCRQTLRLEPNHAAAHRELEALLARPGD